MDTFVYEIDTYGGPMGALSFLPPEEVSETGLRSEGILGLVPPEEEVSDESFTPNPLFIQFLHHVVQKYGPESPALREQAERRRDGWVYIVDGRARGETAGVKPEDILGAFQVQDGEVTSYQPNADYQLMSSRGLVELDEWLEGRLIDELHRLDSAPAPEVWS
jgi:hypothetical protein